MTTFGEEPMHTKVDKTPEELIMTQDTNAVAWAKAFCQLNPEMDEQLMASWFANAMMTMHDRHANKDKKLIHKMRSLLLLTDPSVSNIPMNTTTAIQWDELNRWEEEQKFK